LRLILGGCFLYAGILKIQSPQAFADSIASFQLLPNPFINLLAITLPVFEVIVGLMLITSYECGLAALSVLIVTSVFAVAMISALARGLHVDCGCFGTGEPSAFKTWLSLGRDLLFWGMAWMIWAREATLNRPVEERSPAQD
jgi:uncharacterized membrane protein YphA (DoxX/SURF4 family)